MLKEDMIGLCHGKYVSAFSDLAMDLANGKSKLGATGHSMLN